MLPLLGFRVNIPHRASGLFLFSFWGLFSGSQHQEMFARHHHTPRNTRAKFPVVLVACRKPRHSKKKTNKGDKRPSVMSPALHGSPIPS